MGTIDDIYDALLDEAAFEALPGRLAASVGARSCSFQVIEGQTPIHISTSHFTDEMNQYYLEQGLISADPWHAWGQRHQIYGRAMNSDQYLSRRDFADGAFYNDFFRVFGDDTGVCLGVLLPTQAGLVGLGLQRALRAPGFDTEEVGRLEDLLPHLRRMTDARAMVRSAEAREREAEAVLDRLATGAMLVDACGRIVLANAAAREMLDQRDGMAACGGVLSAVDPATAARLTAALTQATTRLGRFGGAVPVGRPSGGRAYRLVLTPHRPPGSDRTLALVLIDDPERATPDMASILADLFALTPAEADLAVRLLNGASVEEASEARGVRVSTGRTQLKHLLEKTETRRQGEMLSLMARLPGLKRPRE